jgi:hypothetical protein
MRGIDFCYFIFSYNRYRIFSENSFNCLIELVNHIKKYVIKKKKHHKKRKISLSHLPTTSLELFFFLFSSFHAHNTFFLSFLLTFLPIYFFSLLLFAPFTIFSTHMQHHSSSLSFFLFFSFFFFFF